jgi:hypothetical protein
MRPWLNLDQVIHHPHRSLGLLGAGLALIGGFLPWASMSAGYMGATISGAAPAAGGLFLLSIAAAVALFHARGGTAAMVIGGVCGLSAVFALLANPSSAPSLGLLLSMAGAGLIVYAGYQVKL